MRTILFSFALLALISCNDDATNKTDKATETKATETSSSAKGKHFEGIISNGMKGDKISFNISEDGKKLENLTFKGYWRCDGKLESTTAGPNGSYDIVDGKVAGHINEPPNGGSTAWRFDLEATINGDKAEGTFRMNINNLGCDTYKLKWTALPNN
jgi:hypothetical protein